MSAAVLRPATPADVPDIEAIVHGAYAKYTVRIGKPAGPMLDDYAALVARGVVTVALVGGAVAGALVLLAAPDHLLLDNIAIKPELQGRGIGRMLMDFAEAEARRQSFRELRLYTHVTMVENLMLYGRLGFVETHRATVDGYDRVYMQKIV